MRKNDFILLQTFAHHVVEYLTSIATACIAAAIGYLFRGWYEQKRPPIRIRLDRHWTDIVDGHTGELERTYRTLTIKVFNCTDHPVLLGNLGLSLGKGRGIDSIGFITFPGIYRNWGDEAYLEDGSLPVSISDEGNFPCRVLPKSTIEFSIDIDLMEGHLRKVNIKNQDWLPIVVRDATNPRYYLSSKMIPINAPHWSWDP